MPREYQSSAWPIRSTRLLPLLAFLALIVANARAADAPSRWASAWKDSKPLTPEQTRAFIRRLADYVIANHMKKDDSPQRGMTYEYFEVARKGKEDQFVQGEALDTMHDGAWFAVALAAAYRATGDEYYKEALDRWSLSFYCKMLNHGDTLFSGKVVHVRPDKAQTWKESKEWLLQEGEKGFVPYWWDDGGSVSLERVLNKKIEPDFPALDAYLAAHQANPQFRLGGYSLGSSNHMAQDLGVLLEANWLLFRNDPDPRGRKWAAELTDAARNLERCRTNHGSPNIPAVLAPFALATADAKALKAIPDPSRDALWQPDNHYTRALMPAKAGVKSSAPGFADDAEYLYYAGIARAGGELPEPLAFKLIYDAYTHPLLYRYYCDDEAPPPGINGFDLHPYNWIDGKPVDYRSDRKGPGKNPRPTGSRFGPQNMAVCGWALQAMKKYPRIVKRSAGVWEGRYMKFHEESGREIYIDDAPPRAWDKDQIRGGQAVLMGLQGIVPKHDGVEFHLLADRLPFTLKFYTQPNSKGSHVVITVNEDTTASAANDRGEKLMLKTLSVTKEGAIEVFLPATVVKGQGQWGNIIEHGRYSIAFNDQARNLYFMSRAEEVQAALERELSMGLVTWQAIFNELGYVPTGLGEARWQRFSDTGGYAHLIKAASQWLIYLQDRRDWEMLNVPKVN